jgi:hypothetical protein
MKRILALALLLLCAPAAVAAQGAASPAQRIEAARRTAESTGIPASLLDNKVAEGRAKGVPLARIASAVEHRLALLARAHEAMAGEVRGPLTAADLAVGADALAAGVGPETLGSLARSAPNDRRAVAIAVLAQLVQEGDRPERALQRVRVAMADAESLRTLPGRGRQGPAPLERGGHGEGATGDLRGDAPAPGSFTGGNSGNNGSPPGSVFNGKGQSGNRGKPRRP